MVLHVETCLEHSPTGKNSCTILTSPEGFYCCSPYYRLICMAVFALVLSLSYSIQCSERSYKHYCLTSKACHLSQLPWIYLLFLSGNFAWGNPEILDMHFLCVYQIYLTCTNQLYRANTISSKIRGGIWPTVHVVYTFPEWKRQGSRLLYMQ